ncbi:MAG: jacalin-like lectin [Cyanobacteria bacterium J06573_2]
MDLHQLIAQNHDEIHLVVQNPELSLNLATRVEKACYDLNHEERETIAQITPEKWVKLVDALKDDQLFKSYVEQVKNGESLRPSPEDENYVVNNLKKIIEATLGIAIGVASVLLAICTIVATFTGLILGFIAAPGVAIGALAGTTIIFALAANIAFFLGILIGLGAIVGVLLWLFLPDQYPRDPELKGGGGGYVFMDDIPKDAKKISQIDIKYKSEDIVTAIRVHWLLKNDTTSVGQWSSDGSWGGKTEPIKFKADENLIRIEGRAGRYIDQLKFVTQKGSYGPYGGDGGNAFQLSPEIGAIMGFRGRGAGGLDAIGILSGLQRFYHGKFGGVPFCDHVKNVAQISRVTIRSRGWVDGIQVHWTMKDGSSKSGGYHGGSGGIQDSFTLDPNEKITKISGRIGDYVDQLTFHTSKERKYGPYGNGKGKEFSIDIPENSELIGFFGRAEKYLDGIGVLIREKSEAATSRDATAKIFANIPNKPGF